MHKIFNYLDKYFLRNRQQQYLCDMALDEYRDHIFVPIKIAMRKAILEAIHKDRENQQVDRVLIKRAIHQFVVTASASRVVLRKMDGSDELI